MLNNFCFHVYAQKSLLALKMGMIFFYLSIITLACEWTNSRAGSQLKNVKCHLTTAGNQNLQNVML